MARVVARKPPAPVVQEPRAAPPAESCRGCWRADQREVFRLRCGHVFCGPCVTDLARVAMGAPTQLLPLRCCQQPVPAAVLVKVLLAPELAFFQHLTAQGVDARRQVVRDAATAPLVTACDFCGQVVWLLGVEDVDKLLPCGHVYCDDCHEGLRLVAAPGRAVCCAEMPATTRAMAPVVANLESPDAESAFDGEFDDSEEFVLPESPKKHKRAARQPRRPQGVEATKETQTVTPTKTPGKGKRKAPEAVAVEDMASACVACSTGLEGVKTAVRVPHCGHAFCRACVKQRCARATVNEDEGSIGVPLRCCNQLVPVSLLTAALGKKLLTKYDAVVVKRADAVTALPAPKAKAKVVNQANAKRQCVEKSTPTPAITTDPPTPKESCVSCTADATAGAEHLRGSCGHVYCLACLSTMALLSLEDRSLVPIRCCRTEFPMEYVRRALSKDKMAQYERFLAEKDWRASDLKSDHEYARVVKKIRGKQCPACGAGVQKIGGCSWMYCPHGHTFCWKCAANPCACRIVPRAT